MSKGGGGGGARERGIGGWLNRYAGGLSRHVECQNKIRKCYLH